VNYLIAMKLRIFRSFYWITLGFCLGSMSHSLAASTDDMVADEVQAMTLPEHWEAYPFGGNGWFHNFLGTFWTAEGTTNSGWIFLNIFSAIDEKRGGWLWTSIEASNL
jgi:hypothetical protein